MSLVASRIVSNQVLTAMKTEVARQKNLNSLMKLQSLNSRLPVASIKNPIRAMLSSTIAGTLNEGLNDLSQLLGNSIKLPPGFTSATGLDLAGVFQPSSLAALIMNKASSIDDAALRAAKNAGYRGVEAAIQALSGTSNQITNGVTPGINKIADGLRGQNVKDLSSGISPIVDKMKINNLGDFGATSLSSVINSSLSGISSLSVSSTSLNDIASIPSSLASAGSVLSGGFMDTINSLLSADVTSMTSDISSLSSLLSSGVDKSSIKSVLSSMPTRPIQKRADAALNYSYPSKPSDYVYEPLL